MRLQALAAVPHPDGNRIDLRWVNPNPANYPGIRIVRRSGTHPASPEDGVIVVEGENLNHTVDERGQRHYAFTDDQDLKGETVYYYGWFPYRDDPGNPLQRQYDDHALDRQFNRAAAMATSPFGMAGQMYGLLPAIYHRYDADLAQAAGAVGKPGPLRRFLDLPGGQLDQLYSHARALLDLCDPNRVDGRLLPLLAQWIGWQTDYRREFDDQRNEIRNAPHLYRTIGIIPTVEATVKRLLGWESRTKEFVHNVALSNQPERLNLWVRQRASDGAWPAAGKLLSLDFAYEGRASAARVGDGTVWLFYHTLQQDRWEIRYKMLTGGPTVGGYTGSPSQPLNDSLSLDRHPTAAFHNKQLWVFWDSYDKKEQTWRVRFQTRGGDGAWSGIETYGDSERRASVAAVDRVGGLWLFWLEKTSPGWQLHHNRHDGGTWGTPIRFPLDGEVDPRVESDVFILSDANQRLWVFWARRERLARGGLLDNAEQTRWQIAYRYKKSLDLDLSDWSDIFPLPKEQEAWVNADDREPAAWVNEKGQIELFWSSTRTGGWSIWHTVVDGDKAQPAESITGTPYSQRAPLPLPLGDDLLLLYRSNESLRYASEMYAATETLDNRYAGCTTVDTRNAAKIALRRQFQDFQTYTYSTGRDGKRGDGDWYARDTVGIYLTPTPQDEAVISENRRRLKAVLQQFLPIQVRPVFIIELTATETVYTYDFPKAAEPRLIVEGAFDSIKTTDEETYSGVIDSHRDLMLGWAWMRSWSSAYPDHHTVDFTQTPITTISRTWHTGLEGD